MITWYGKQVNPKEHLEDYYKQFPSPFLKSIMEKDKKYLTSDVVLTAIKEIKSNPGKYILDEEYFPFAKEPLNKTHR